MFLAFHPKNRFFSLRAFSSVRNSSTDIWNGRLESYCISISNDFKTFLMSFWSTFLFKTSSWFLWKVFSTPLRLKMALSILFFVLKQVRVRASNCYSSLSLNYSYLNGSIKITADSTLGGGVKAFLSTLNSNRCVVVNSLVFIESLE